MKNEWLVETTLPVSFKIETVKNLLNPETGTLLELGDSSRRLIFVDSSVFSFFGKKIHSYFSEAGRI